MSDPTSAAALTGAGTGPVCDTCAKAVNTGDIVRAYATHDETDGWALRWLWCEDCGDTTIEPGTSGTAEVLVEAVFLAHQLVSVEVLDRSPEAEGEVA